VSHLHRPLFVLLASLWLGLASCAHSQRAGSVSFRVQSNVPEATVWIDGVLVGKASDWARDGRHIRAGFHRIEVRAPGYYSVFQEVDQPDGGKAVIPATLHPLLE
jgi:hypothetical protein